MITPLQRCVNWFSLCLLAVGLLFSTVAKADCIPFSDLKAPTTHCYWGTFANPYMHHEVVDHGAVSPDKSHHTINTNIAERDPRTDNKLKVIPDGEFWSARIGNWLDGFYSPTFCDDPRHAGEGEAIMYDLMVEDAFPIVMIKFAVVLEEPNHNDGRPEMEPKLKIEVLDDHMQPISGGCGYFEYRYSDAGHTWGDYIWRAYNIKNYSKKYGRCTFIEGWENHHVKWHDWMSIGVGLQDYVGQRVHIRITSGDCGYTNHFGYTYVHLKCIEKEIPVPECGDKDHEVTFTAPEGFQYLWYKILHGNRVGPVGSGRTITVKSDRTLYECEAQSAAFSACKFTMRVQADPRLPKADFSVDKRVSCVDTFYLTNLSAVSPDGFALYSPHEDVDAVEWDFGDGRKSTEHDISKTPIIYKNTGNYTIKLTAKLTNGNCVDVKTIDIHAKGFAEVHEKDLYDTICAGDYRMFETEKLTKTGVYTHHTPTGEGCDSITRFHLQVWPSYFYSDTVDLCEGNVYKFHKNGHERIIHSTGLYYDSLTTKHGCDSVYRVLVRFHKKYTIMEEKTICEGDSILYHRLGRPVYYKQAGLYSDSLLTKTYGCDSVYWLDLKVKKSYHFYESQKGCRGTPFHYHGETYTNDGNYEVKFTSQTTGCDSIYHLTLTMNPTYKVDTFVTISDQQIPFVFRGRNYTTTGVYPYVHQTKEGCDSIVRLNLKVCKTYRFVDAPVTICQGEYYNFHDTIISTTGDYTRRFKTVVGGYDSIYTIHVTVKPVYRTPITVHIADGDSYQFLDGSNLTTSGVYYYTYGHTSTRCDSVIELTLVVHSKYHIPETATICRGDSFLYHKNGKDIYYKEAKVYYDSLKTTFGYDSVYVLTLRVLPYYKKTESKTLCENELSTYRWHDMSFTKSGVYYDSLKTKTVPTCDSIWQLNLTVNPTYIKEDSVAHICKGSHFLFGAKQLTSAGIYYDTLKTKNGCLCDSVIKLTLYVHDVYNIDTVAHLCQGDTLNWYGQKVFNSGDYHYRAKKTADCNCDSNVHLIAHIHPTYRYPVEKVRIGEGQTYTWHNAVYATAGTYTAGGETMHHCDSIYTLELEVMPKQVIHLVDTICTGSTYTFRNKYQLNRGGNYYDTLRYTSGFDSVIYYLELREFSPSIKLETLSICYGDTALWHNKKVYRAETYYDSLTNKYGCDSIHQLKVTVNPTPTTHLVKTICSTEAPYYFSQKGFDVPLSVSGDYYDTLKTVGCHCDSVVILHLTVHQAYNYEIDSTICEGSYMLFGGQSRTTGGKYVYNGTTKKGGCDSIVTLNLTVEPIVRMTKTVDICKGSSYHFDGQDLTVSGQYIETKKSVLTGCDSITTLTLRVHEPFKKEINATVCANAPYNFMGVDYTTSQVLSWTGRRVGSGCDSTHIVHLTVNPVYTKDTTVHMCTGTPVIVFGQSYDHGGHYTATLPTQGVGCDSTYNILIVEHLPSYIKESATMCKGTSYTWVGHKNDTVLKAPGVYYDRHINKAGCDSVYELTLNELQKFYQEIQATISGNEWYDFHGRMLNQSGVYWDSLISNVTRCDSVYKLTLTVNPVYDTIVYHRICEGETFQFGVRTLTESGRYTDTLKTVLGEDSIVTLALTVYKPIIVDSYVHKSVKEVPYTWHGTDYSITGVYDHQETSVLTHCDSINRLHLYFHPVYEIHEHEDICKGKHLSWHNKDLFETGTYYDSLKTDIWGYDSVHVMHLTVNPTYLGDTLVYICEGDHFDYNHKRYTTAGTFYDSLKTVHGHCDSVMRLTVVVPQKYLYEETYTICGGDSIQWHKNGKTVFYKNKGVYWDSLKTKNAPYCDSVYRMTLNVQEPFVQADTVTICQGSYQTFFGRTLRKSGDYEEIRTGLVCDSLYTLHLNVIPYDTVRLHYVMCENDEYEFSGNTLTKGGFYRDTRPSLVTGCDSTTVLTLIVNPIKYKTIETHIVQGDSVKWHKNGTELFYKTTGTYTDTLKSTAHCDSITSLQLIVHKTGRDSLNVSMCEGRSYNFNGVPLYETGIYRDTAKNVYGLDSMFYVVNLVVNDTTVRDTSIFLCETDYFEYNNHKYTTPGFFIDTAKTSCGCDSVLRLHIQKQYVERHEDVKYICDGESYRWRGKDYDVSGTYIDTIRTKSDLCDSVIYTLKLGVNPVLHAVEEVSACTKYRWHNVDYTASGIYYDEYKNQFGCDSTYCLKLTIHQSPFVTISDTICQGENYTFGKYTPTTSGVYYDTIRLATGCDSVTQLKLVVNNKYYKRFADQYLCEGDSVKFGNRWLKSTGVYTDNLKSVAGCDSVVQMQVFVQEHIVQEWSKTICEGESYHFVDQDVAEEKTYERHFLSQHGCDSFSYILHLKVMPKFENIHTYSQICDGDYVMFGGRAITTPGLHTHNFQTLSGCDSTVTLHLSVYPKKLEKIERAICEGDSLKWIKNDRIIYLKRAGIYEDTLRTSHGCDSVVQLHLTVNKSYFDEDVLTICANEKLIWHGQALKESGTYWDRKTTIKTGCDSIAKLTLTVLPVTIQTKDTTICSGEFCEFRGNLLTEDGIYTDTIKSTLGCDSIFRLVLHKAPKYKFFETKNICSGNYYMWHKDGQPIKLTKPGTYYDSLQTKHTKCDSVYVLRLLLDNSYFNSDTIAICGNSPYVWRGRNYYETGVYRDTVITMAGCDSVCELVLTVNPVRFTNLSTVELCDGELYEFNGRFLRETGTYIDTLKTLKGCDSVVQVNIIKHMSYHYRLDTTICESDHFVFVDGKERTKSGKYNLHYQTIHGCDSDYVLNLKVKRDYHNDTTVAMCSNEKFWWQGQPYTQAGNYEAAFVNAAGCDSIYRLNLIVNPSYKFENSFSSCDMQTFYFKGKELTESGVYYDSLTTHAGCDSIYILHFTLNPTRRDSDVIRLCAGEFYEWYDGRLLTRSGIYSDTIDDPITRQCMIYTLDLAFIPPTVISHIFVDDICAGDEKWSMQCYFAGAKPQTFSLLFDDHAREVGFADLRNVPYTDEITGFLPHVPEGTYIRPDHYKATIIFDNAVCQTDTSNTASIDFLVRYPSWVIEQNWNDVVAVLNEKYNGGYLFSKYDWYINKNATDVTGPYLYMPRHLRLGDEVAVGLTRLGEDYSIPSCPIIISDRRDSLLTDFPVLCAPTKAPAIFRITAKANGTYKLYDAKGHWLKDGSYNDGEDKMFDTPHISGIYLIVLTTEKGQSKTQKLFVP